MDLLREPVEAGPAYGCTATELPALKTNIRLLSASNSSAENNQEQMSPIYLLYET